MVPAPSFEVLERAGRLSPDALLDRILPAGEEGNARVVAIMIGSADGRATVSGRSGGLGHPADRELLRGLRARADAVLVGSGTLAAERYGRLVDDGSRAARVARGQSEHPVIATISRDGTLPAGLPLLAEPGVPIRVFAETEAAPDPGWTADVRIDALAPASPAAAVDALAAAGARLIACEGGPTLLARLIAAGRVDDLLLTVAPRLVAGDGPAIVEGDELDARLDLIGVASAGDHLFLHYRVAGR